MTPYLFLHPVRIGSMSGRFFEGIKSADDDFLASERELDTLDDICMVLIVVGDNFKSIDRMAESKILSSTRK